MRHFVLRTITLLSLGLVLSCSNDLSPELPIDPLAGKAIEISYANSALSSGINRLSQTSSAKENEIKNLEAYVFDDNDQLIRKFSSSSGLQVLEDSKIRLVISESEVADYLNREIRIIMIVNYPMQEEVKSILDLQNHILTKSLNKDNLGSFVMTGSLTTNKIAWAKNNPIFEFNELLKLSRIAAKVQFRIKDIAVSSEMNNTRVDYELVGSPEIRLINYSSHSSLISKIQNSEFPLSSTEYVTMVDDGAGYALGAAYYSYESDWSMGGGYNIDREAHLMLKLKFKAIDTNGIYGEEKEYFYHTPINYRFPIAEMSKDEIASLYKIERNHLYRIVSSIQQLGSEDEGEPFELDSQISTEPWVDHAIDGNIDAAHFLMVKEKISIMPNIDQIKLNYQSSLPIVITDIKTEYTVYDSAGNESKKVVQNPSSLEVKIIEDSNQLKISSPIPTNYVPLNIHFTVRHKEGSNLNQEVHIIQYPPKYVTATRSRGFENSYRTSPFADFRFHDTLGLTSRASGGGRSPQANNVFYRITTLVNSDDEFIGDVAGNDGVTKRDPTTNRLVSPDFIIATQHGLSIAVPQYQGRGSGYWRIFDYAKNYGPVERFKAASPYVRLRLFNDRTYIAYTSATGRCSDYFEGEYGMNGTYEEHFRGPFGLPQSRKVYKRFKYQGRWRIPTLAELQYINKIQDDYRSVVKSLLWGEHYWSAQTGVAYNFEDNHNTSQSDANVRCVFDTWKIKNHD